jgi:hypothetical protein
MQEMHIKYKILWFCVDTHHRERYFFICGCKQTVNKSGVTCRRAGVEYSRRRSNPSNLFPVFAKTSVRPLSGFIKPVVVSFSPILPNLRGT